MIKAFPLAVMITSCLYFAHAQSSSTLMGARANGMGYTSSCLTDEWSIFNNIGGLSEIEVAVAGFTYDSQPSFKPFNKAAAVFAIPLKIGAIGLGMYRFGDALYNEQILTTGFANKFGLASIGIKVNYVQYNIEGLGRKAVFSFSFGGIAEITPELSVGAHIVNLNQPRISDVDDEQLPTVLIAGISFSPSNKIILTTELEKDLDHKPTWKTGIEYRLHKKLDVRTGFNLYPNAGFFGLGFKPRKFSLDYAFSYRTEIRPRHQASVVYKFNKVEKK